MQLLSGLSSARLRRRSAYTPPLNTAPLCSARHSTALLTGISSVLKRRHSPGHRACVAVAAACVRIAHSGSKATAYGLALVAFDTSSPLSTLRRLEPAPSCSLHSKLAFGISSVYKRRYASTRWVLLPAVAWSLRSTLRRSAHQHFDHPHATATRWACVAVAAACVRITHSGSKATAYGLALVAFDTSVAPKSRARFMLSPLEARLWYFVSLQAGLCISPSGLSSARLRGRSARHSTALLSTIGQIPVQPSCIAYAVISSIVWWVQLSPHAPQQATPLSPLEGGFIGSAPTPLPPYAR